MRVIMDAGGAYGVTGTYEKDSYKSIAKVTMAGCKYLCIAAETNGAQTLVMQVVGDVGGLTYVDSTATLSSSGTVTLVEIGPKVRKFLDIQIKSGNSGATGTYTIDWMKGG